MFSFQQTAQKKKWKQMKKKKKGYRNCNRQWETKNMKIDILYNYLKYYIYKKKVSL